MKNRTYRNTVLVSLIFISFFCAACSSAPKRQMIYYDVSSLAYDNYEKANGAITRGNYEQAEKYLENAYAKAVSIDKNELICKTLLSAVSLRLQSPKTETSANDFGLPSDLEDLISEAKIAASFCDNSIRPVLESVIRVYEARIKLDRARNNLESITNSEIQKYLDEEIKNLTKEPYYLAFLYRTKGEWAFFLMNYKSAAEHFKIAADIHTKNRYLYEIAYDWYLCATSFSKDGKKAEAIDAIQTALKYDRDAENSAAIAQDYMASAYILIRNSPTSSEKEQALFNARRAESVYKSIGLEEQAQACAEWILENK